MNPKSIARPALVSAIICLLLTLSLTACRGTDIPPTPEPTTAVDAAADAEAGTEASSENADEDQADEPTDEPTQILEPTTTEPAEENDTSVEIESHVEEDPLFTGWSLQSISGEAVEQAHPPFATFENAGGFFGFDGCNQFSTSFEVDGETIKFEPALLTHVGCKAPEERLADQVHTVYKNAAGYEVTDESLRLLDSAGDVLAEFAQAPAVVLADTTWSLMAYRNGDGDFIGAVPDAEVYLLFSEGNLTGNTGCVSFDTTFSADGNEIALDELVVLPLGAPTIDCETAGPLLDQQGNFLSALADVDGYEIAGTSLSLNDEAGAPVAVLLSMAEFSPIGPQTSDAPSDTPSAVELERLADAEYLYNHTWYWIQKTDDGNTVAVETPSDFTLFLDASGELQTSTPCGTGDGSWRVNLEELTLNFVAERRFCRDDEELSYSYLSDLTSVESYAIDEDGRIILKLRFGTGELIFDRELGEE